MGRWDPVTTLDVQQEKMEPREPRMSSMRRQKLVTTLDVQQEKMGPRDDPGCA